MHLPKLNYVRLQHLGLGHEVNTALQHDLQLFLSNINDSPES